MKISRDYLLFNCGWAWTSSVCRSQLWASLSLWRWWQNLWVQGNVRRKQWTPLRLYGPYPCLTIGRARQCERTSIYTHCDCFKYCRLNTKPVIVEQFPSQPPEITILICGLRHQILTLFDGINPKWCRAERTAKFHKKCSMSGPHSPRVLQIIGAKA